MRIVGICGYGGASACFLLMACMNRIWGKVNR